MRKVEMTGRPCSNSPREEAWNHAVLLLPTGDLEIRRKALFHPLRSCRAFSFQRAAILTAKE